MQHLKLIAKLAGKLHFYDCKIEKLTQHTHTHTDTHKQEQENVANYISTAVGQSL